MKVLCPVDFSMKYVLTLVLSCFFFLNQDRHHEIPPFIFPELDQAVASLWLAASEQSNEGIAKAGKHLQEVWQASREDIVDFPITEYNPYLLVGVLDAMMHDLEKAQQKSDYAELLALGDRFLWEFQSIREFHRQHFYPLDYWWKVQSVFQEIHAATHDPQLALLEWQELECLFDEMVCLLVDYEDHAESYLTQYVPNVDEDAHKEAMNQVYQCINDYRTALTSGYQEELVWPCDQLEEGLKTILRCYLTKEQAHL